MDITFLVCLALYIALLILMSIVIAIFLKYLGVFEIERLNIEDGRIAATPSVISISIETLPLMNGKKMPRLYGATDREDDTSSSSSVKPSDDLSGGTICVICFDDCRNCFFAPCGHFTTCFTCAKKIAGGNSKVCPICRGSIKAITKFIET